MTYLLIDEFLDEYRNEISKNNEIKLLLLK